jgi:hypothetical protein
MSTLADPAGHDGWLLPAVRFAAMPHVKDQHHDLIVVDLVQDSPVTGPDSPGPRITDQLRGLSWPGILCEPVDRARNLLLNRTIEPLERLTGSITEDDLVSHRLQASLSLDLIPRDKRLAFFYSGASLAGCSGVSEVF